MRMPTVPQIVTDRKMYSCKRSMTIAIYLQSSKIYFKQKENICT